ncbi:MAG: hypothetical protein FJ042_06495, partial [Candidatus Cloacimonetes bacterium]|nr:hypothetical protein [Candidatus Cloacimonadota bacterium]
MRTKIRFACLVIVVFFSTLGMLNAQFTDKPGASMVRSDLAEIESIAHDNGLSVNPDYTDYSRPQTNQTRVTKTSIGSTWGTSTHWSPSGVPTSADDVIINTNMAVAAAASCLSLTVNSGFTLTINSTRSVTVGVGGAIVNGTITQTAGTSTTTTSLTLSGNLTVNSTGVVTATANFTRLYFAGTVARVFTNNGTVSAPLNMMTLANSGGVTMAGSNQVVCFRINLFYGTLSNAEQITLGNGGTTAAVVQIAVNASYPRGQFDESPTFNYGTGGLQLLYAPASASYSTSYEVPTDGVVAYLLIVTGTGVTVSMSGDITVPWIYTTGLNLSSGNLSIGSNTLTMNGTIGVGTGTLTGGTTSNMTYSGLQPTILPAVVNGLNELTINSDSSQSMTGNVTVHSKLYLLKERLFNASYLTLANGATISRNSSGELQATPTFSGTVDIEYSGASAVTTGFEIPSGSGVLNVLTTNSGGVTQGPALTPGAEATIYSQGFNSTDDPTGWARAVVTDGGTTGTPEISYITSGANPTASPQEGTHFVKFNSYDCDDGDQARLYMTSPVSTSGKKNIVVRFAWYLSGTYTDPDNVTVVWSLDGTNWINSLVYSRYSTATPAWTTISCLLPRGAENQSNLYVGFLFTSQYGLNCYLDNVRIIDITPSQSASNLTINGDLNLTGNYTIGTGNSLTLVNDLTASTGVLVLNDEVLTMDARDFTITGTNTLSSLTVTLNTDSQSIGSGESIDHTWNIDGIASGTLTIDLSWPSSDDNGNVFDDGAAIYRHNGSAWIWIASSDVTTNAGIRTISYPYTFDSSKAAVNDVTITEKPIFDYPEGIPVAEGDDIIHFTDENANAGSGSIPPYDDINFILTTSYIFELIGSGPWTFEIATAEPWGAYHSNSSWHLVQNVGGKITFSNISSSKDKTLPVILGDVDNPLPVVLSSFSAIINADNHVAVQWTTQFESNCAGYYIYRHTINEFALASKLDTYIQAANTSHQQVYVYVDKEIYESATYYYWLEAMEFDGQN